MSFGYVTVGQCVESLPTGRLVWEVIFCAFLVSFLVGAVDEAAPPLLLNASAYQNRAALAILLGGFIGNVAGWIADVSGRSSVIQPALLLAICCGFLMEFPESSSQVLLAHFMLGIVSSCLQIAVMPLIAELLPLQHRSFYLMILCAGWPAGALSSVACSCWGLSWQALNLFALLPAVLLYTFVRAGMLPESPRHLYVLGEKDDGYTLLLDMYEKNDLLLSWAQDAVSLKAEPEGTSAKASSDGSTKAWLMISCFSLAFLSQFITTWFPMILVADQPYVASRDTDAILPGYRQQWLHAPYTAHPGSAPSVLQIEPNLRVASATMMCYVLQLLSVIVAANLSTCVARRHMVLAAMLLAPVLGAAAIFATMFGGLLLCCILFGCQLAALATVLNLLKIFACEHFPTSSRASTMALTVLASQLGSLAPLLSTWSMDQFSAPTVTIALSVLYMVGLLAAFKLPLPLGKCKPLRDLDEIRRHKDKRSKEWVTYQTI